jgi:putative metalloenzyme radical SAM/SPASM domain maturase
VAVPLPPAARAHPSKLFVEVTTRCNLLCPMCVKQAPGGGVAKGDLSERLFSRLEPAFPTLDGLILNGIGEPLLHPELETFVERAKAKMPAHADVAFQTNGTLLKPARAERLVRAGVDRICISLDAVSPSLTRTLRQGTELTIIEQAFANLEAAKKRVGRDNPKVGLEFVVMRQNFAELPDVVSWAADHGVSFIIVTQMLPYDAAGVSATAHATSTDRAIELFAQWKDRAITEGIDLKRYAGVFMKYRRTPEEERVVAFAGELLAEAHRRGIFLRLETLLQDDELHKLVAAVFSEAEARATARGVQLTLPRLAPSHVRSCEFVEDGGAFVSWDGQVHPCYFLWHRYQCFVGGHEKRVKPMAFGGLDEGDILDVWNTPRFARFRKGVLKYDFPFCYDCRLALCDYAREEDFEQDCYTNEVPCGACLWCTGLFHCLT